MINAPRNSVRLLAVAAGLYSLTFSGMLLAQIIADRNGFSLAMLTREPTTALDGPFWVGCISNIGAVLWCVTAGVALFSAVILWNRRDRQTGFIALAGVLTTCLMVDDFFMLHDGMAWAIARINEKKVLAAWGVMGLAWLILYRRNILKSDYLLLFSAGLWLGLSAVVDMGIIRIDESRRHLWEDGFKLMGIVGWSVYLCRTSYYAVTATLAVPVTAAEPAAAVGTPAMRWETRPGLERNSAAA